MQTIPIATTSFGGQAQALTAAAAAGKPGSAAATVFAGLVQALTGGVQSAAVPAALPGRAGAAVEGEAAPEGALAQPSEGEDDGEGEGEDVVAVLVPQLQVIQTPVAAPATSASGGAASAGPSPFLPQLPGGALEVALPLHAQPACSVDPAMAGADVDTPAPPSAQAVELAKALGSGTQVEVAVTAADAGPGARTVQGLVGVAVAAALEQAPVAAAQPLLRPVATEPKKASPLAAAVSAPPGGEASQIPSNSAIAAPWSPSAGTSNAAPDAQSATPAAGDSLPAASTAPSAGGASTPDVAAAGEAAAPPADATPPGRDGQSAPNQLPAPAAASSSQPATPMPERAVVPASPPPAPAQVSVHIAKGVRAGLDRIHIQLEPASLGRVEISLDLSDTRHVRASISVETSDALELLRADARGLERALQDAGLKTDSSSLNFQLRDHGARPGHDGGSRQGYGAQPQSRTDIEDSDASRLAETPARAVASTGAISAGRIDIHA